MNVDQLYEMLRELQEPKGFYFNQDREKVVELLQGLLTNKSRYGYMCCPCRLAAADKDWDRDIICPCVYRDPDVAEYGSCYCNCMCLRPGTPKKFLTPLMPERRPRRSGSRCTASPNTPSPARLHALNVLQEYWQNLSKW
jgi:ferredoxin-thioredoxin reductase catalytic subunit